MDSCSQMFYKLKEQLNIVIYKSVYVLMKNSDSYFYLDLGLNFIFLLQFLYFSFCSQVKSAWIEWDDNTNKFVETISSFFSYFILKEYLIKGSYEQFAIVMYLCCSFVVILIGLLIYIKIQYDKKTKYLFNMPKLVAKIMITLSLSIFFNPIFDTFINVFNCQKNDSGQYYHYYFVQSKCFDVRHTADIVIAIIFLVLFLYFLISIQMIYFETNQFSDNVMAKKNSLPQLVQLMNMAIQTSFYTFSRGENEIYYLMFINILGNITAFYYFNLKFQNLFFDEYVTKSYSIFTSIQVFTSFMFLIAYTMSPKYLQIVPEIWIICLPLIVLIVIQKSFFKKKKLTNTFSQAKNGDEVIEQIRLLYQLINSALKNPKSQQMLEAFIEVHKVTCFKPDCAILQNFSTNPKQKVQKKSYISQSKAKTILSDINSDNQVLEFSKSQNSQSVFSMSKQSVAKNSIKHKASLVTKTINELFLTGMRKFPDHAELKLQYGFYLLQVTFKQSQGLQQFEQARDLSKSYQMKFMTQRFVWLVSDQMAEQQNFQKQDVLTEMAFQNYLKQFMKYLEQSVLIHMDFWLQLTEEIPDLGKLSDIGQKVFKLRQKVEEEWLIINSMNSGQNLVKITNIFSLYVLEILNDKVRGQELVQQYLYQKTELEKEDRIKIMSNLDEINEEQAAIAIVSAEKDKFSQIIGLNSSCCAMFGHQKYDILYKDVEQLMPNLYSQYHSEILSNAATRKNWDQIIIKERYVFGLHANQYAFSLFIQIEPLQTLSQNMEYISKIRVSKKFRGGCEILSDSEGNIQNLSAECISILYLENRNLKQYYDKAQVQLNIDDLFPNILKKYENGDLVKNNIVQYIPNKKLIEKQKQKLYMTRFNIQVQPIIIEQISTEPIGYQFQLERTLQNALSSMASQFTQSTQLIQSQQLSTISKTQQYSFCFNFETKTITGRYIEREHSVNKPNQSLMIIEEDDQEEISNKQKQSDKKLKVVEGQDPLEMDMTNSLFNNQEKEENKKLLNKQKSDIKQPKSNSTQDYSVPAKGDKIQSLESQSKNQIGEIQYNGISDDEIQNALIGQDNLSMNDQESDYKQKYDENGKVRYDYKIRTVRLTGGIFQDIINEQFEVQSLGHSNNLQKKKEKQEAGQFSESMTDFSSSIQLNRVLNLIIKDSSDPQSVSIIKKLAIFFFLLILSLIIIDFILAYSNYKSAANMMGIIINSAWRLGHTQRILGCVQDLEVLQRGIYDGLLTTEAARVRLEDEQNGYIADSMQGLWDIQESILNTDYTRTEAIEKFMEQRSVGLYFYPFDQENDEQQYYTLDEAVQIFLNYVQKIQELNYKEVTLNNSAVYFIERNMFSTFAQTLEKIYNLYVEQQYDAIKSNDTYYIIIFIIGTILMITTYFSIIPYLVKTEKILFEEVLILFLGIPQRTVKQLFQKCDSYLISLQLGEFGDVEHQEENNEQKMEEEIEIRHKQRIKGKKNKTSRYKNHKNSNLFIILSAIFLLVIEFYFLYTFLISHSIAQQFLQVVQYINYTAILVPQFNWLDNIQREFLLYPFQFQFYGQDPWDVARDKIEYIEQIDSNMQISYQDNVDTFTIYEESYQEMMYGDACPVITQYGGFLGIMEDCVNADKDANIQISPTEGMRLVTAHFINCIKYVKYQIDTMVDNQDNWDSATHGQFGIYAIVSKYELSNRILLKKAFYQSFTYLTEQFLKDINQAIKNIQNKRIVFLIVYISTLTVLFVGLWIPYMKSVTTRSSQTKTLIKMIPFNIIVEQSNIKRYIRQQVIQYSRQNF